MSREDVAAVLDGAALHVRAGWATWRARGADRLDYLDRMLSQDLRGLEAGRAAPACVLDARARMLGDPTVWCLEDELILDLDARAIEFAVPHLERTVLADDVVFEDASADHAHFVVVGPRAPEVLASLGPDAEVGRHIEVVVAGATCRVLRLDRSGAPCLHWIVRAEELEAVRRFLLEALPLHEVGAEAFDAWRVRHRVPAWGAELGPDVMPLEAGLGEYAVSFTKGCYPGQEPVAKAHHFGQPPNLLVVVAVEGAERLVPPLRLLEGERPMGRITTLAPENLPDGARALGRVRTAQAVGGSRFTIEGGGEARVLDP